LASPHVEYLGHHWLLLAGPAFLPAVIVVAVVLYVAIKDRRQGDDAPDAGDTAERHLRSVNHDDNSD
jgi:hypothetical protein